MGATDRGPWGPSPGYGAWHVDTEQGATRETQGREGLRPSPHPRDGGGPGCRRGPQYRWHLPDNTTGREGRDPGSGCVSPSQGAGDWREPDTSRQAPAAPRGALHQGQAGASLPLLPAVRQGVSDGYPGTRLRPQQAEGGRARRGRGDVRRHRGRRRGAMAGRSAGGAAHGDVPSAPGAAGAHPKAGRNRGATTGDSRDSGPRGPNRRPADPAADLRRGSGPHGLWLSAGVHGSTGRPGSAPGAVRRAHPGDRRRRVELLGDGDILHPRFMVRMEKGWVACPTP